MRCTVQMGVQRRGRLLDLAGPVFPFYHTELSVPEDITSEPLRLTIAAEAVNRALAQARCDAPELDIVEITVNFEEDTHG